LLFTGILHKSQVEQQHTFLLEGPSKEKVKGIIADKTAAFCIKIIVQEKMGRRNPISIAAMSAMAALFVLLTTCTMLQSR
jgi:hypothetical protein